MWESEGQVNTSPLKSRLKSRHGMNHRMQPCVLNGAAGAGVLAGGAVRVGVRASARAARQSQGV